MEKVLNLENSFVIIYGCSPDEVAKNGCKPLYNGALSRRNEHGISSNNLIKEVASVGPELTNSIVFLRVNMPGSPKQIPNRDLILRVI